MIPGMPRVFTVLTVCLEDTGLWCPPLSVSPLGQVFRPDSTRVGAAEIGRLAVQNFLCRTQEPESHNEV